MSIKRYSSDFRGRVALLVRSGSSPQAVALRLGLSLPEVQKWAKEYAIKRKKLTNSELKIEIASLEREVRARAAAPVMEADAGGDLASSLSYHPIPYAINQPHFPNGAPNGTVVPANMALNINTSPAWWDADKDHCVLVTAWIQWVTITVVDASGKVIGSHFDNWDIYEQTPDYSWRPINRKLNNGTYSDPVCIMAAKGGGWPPTVITASSQAAKDWPSAATETMPEISKTLDRYVAVGDPNKSGYVLLANWSNHFSDSPAIQNRTIISTFQADGANNIQVTWPDSK